MDGFVSALKRLTLATNYTRWSPSFSKMVQQVSARNTGPGRHNGMNLHDRIALLRKLDPYIKQPCFTNTDEQEMLQAKRDLLMLWEYLLEFIVVMAKPAVKELGYALIVMLMQREEFTLRKLGFGPNSTVPRCSQAHLALASKYKVLLLQTFMFVVKAMTAKGKFAEIVHFSAQTLVVFFFRLPLVGGSIIDALEKKVIHQRSEAAKFPIPSIPYNDSLDQLSETAVANKSKAEVTSSDSSSSSPPVTLDAINPHVDLAPSRRDPLDASFILANPDLFQWSYFNSEEEANALGPNVLSEEKGACFSWLSTKETFFLTFVEVYVVHVEGVATKPVHWQVIPAYDLMLECFWPLLKSSMWWDGICKRKVGESNGWVGSLPAYMRVKRSALALLSNKSLVNKYIKLTFECTNVHSLLSVDSCVEHLNLWFSTVAYSSTAREGIVNHNQNSKNTPPAQKLVEGVDKKEKPSLPDSFDYDNYWFGVEVLLQSELFQVLLKVCSLLHNTLHLFHGKLRTRFVTDLMNKFFFRLFLHWSSEVRTFFQITLVYKVLRSDRRNLPCFTDAQVIREYGSQVANTSKNLPLLQRRSSFGELKSATSKDKSGIPANIYSGESAMQRRMAIFDNTNTTDNEELLVDMMFCSKIDSFVRMCLEQDNAVPEDRRPYIEASLRQYASILEEYYAGVTNNTMENLPHLAHRMVYTEFGTSD